MINRRISVRLAALAAHVLGTSGDPLQLRTQVSFGRAKGRNAGKNEFFTSRPPSRALGLPWLPWGYRPCLQGYPDYRKLPK